MTILSNLWYWENNDCASYKGETVYGTHIDVPFGRIEDLARRLLVPTFSTEDNDNMIRQRASVICPL